VARISQREARRLQKRVQELERERQEQRSAWSKDYPGGVNIDTLDLKEMPSELAAIHTARLLGHAVVAVDHGTSVFLYALPVSK
jgi:hypothetical protein